jgi:gamma-glutamylcysteine synthetase
MSIPQTGGGPIEDISQLAEYLASGCKPKEDWRIGTEHEKFGYCRDTLNPCPMMAHARSRPCWKGCATASAGRLCWKQAILSG